MYGTVSSLICSELLYHIKAIIFVFQNYERLQRQFERFRRSGTIQEEDDEDEVSTAPRTVPLEDLR